MFWKTVKRRCRWKFYLSSICKNILSSAGVIPKQICHKCLKGGQNYFLIFQTSNEIEIFVCFYVLSQMIVLKGLLTAHFVWETFWWNPFQIRPGAIFQIFVAVWQVAGSRGQGQFLCHWENISWLLNQIIRPPEYLNSNSGIGGLFDYIYISILHTMDRIFIFYHNLGPNIMWAVRNN